jgi:prepilin-type N-terminal cleavage/methylation domain-containing protein
MPRRVTGTEGFTLVELAIVLVVIGIVLAMGVPGFRSLSADQQLHGAAQGVAGQVTLARARAMSTGTTQTINFDAVSVPPRVFIIGAGGSRSWMLPREVSFATGGSSSFDLTSDGRASASRYIVLQNSKGIRDTISVQSSGLVLAR